MDDRRRVKPDIAAVRETQALAPLNNVPDTRFRQAAEPVRFGHNAKRSLRRVGRVEMDTDRNHPLQNCEGWFDLDKATHGHEAGKRGHDRRGYQGYVEGIRRKRGDHYPLLRQSIARVTTSITNAIDTMPSHTAVGEALAKMVMLRTDRVCYSVA